jgi:aryl-alcohol dehydrogenase-like predicted oxidoreductase
MQASCAASCGTGPGCAAVPVARPVFATPWRGACSEAGTRSFAAAHADAGDGHFRRDPQLLGEFLTPGQRVRSTPWVTLSSLGVGTYLGDEDDRTDAAVTRAVHASVRAGWNVIDTAVSYRSERGERAVGAALAQLRSVAARGDARLAVSRGALLLCSKAGFLPPALLAPHSLPAAAVAETVNGHCIHPACLRASLARTLSNLNVATLDVLYLHNAAEAQLAAVGTTEFMRRLRAAFGALETERAEGRITAYGLATWDCFRVPRDDARFLDLQAVVDAAAAAGGANHGLRYLQAPLSAALPQALHGRVHAARPLRDGERADGLTLLEAATRLGLAVVASGSLAEGDALRGVAAALASEPLGSPLLRVRDPGAKLLQWARSAPLLTAALVGHKAPAHVAENAALTRVPLLTPSEFEEVTAWLAPRALQPAA